MSFFTASSRRARVDDDGDDDGDGDDDAEDGGADDDDVAGSAAAVAAVDIFLPAARKPEFQKQGDTMMTQTLFVRIILPKELRPLPCSRDFFFGFLKLGF